MTGRAESRLRILKAALGGISLLALAAAVGSLGSCERPGEFDRPGDDVAGTAPRNGERQSRPLEASSARRFADLFSSHAHSGSEPLTADDLCTLGAGLLRDGRLGLGWSALEAARRIEPGHAAARRALDELEGKLIVAAGPDQAARREAAEDVEFLGTVRGGPALGLLVLGLAHYAGDAGRERDFLDRLRIRDRSELSSTDTPAGAARLIARLLMETGRPAEAGDLLCPLADGPAVDREAAWLLSRAALQLGKGETADAMLDRSSGFVPETSSREPAPFVGSRKCAECHRSALREARLAAPHARTIYLGPGLKQVPLPDGPVTDPVDPRLEHRFLRKSADRIEVEARDMDGRIARAVVAYAIGSGKHGITMIGREGSTGIARELRISYYALDGSWGPTKGVEMTPHGPAELMGLGLTQKMLHQCLHCHTTWFRAALPIPSVPSGPEAGDRGIGCERCHGPGLNHVKAVETGYADSAIGLTRRSSARELLRSCEDCHASNGLVDSSDPEFARLQGTTLKFSRCFTESRGAIHCTTCHDPHRELERTTCYYEAKCLACHTAPGAVDSGSGRGNPTACPINPSSGCIDCHMPKVVDQTFKVTISDHHIRVHREPIRGHAGGHEQGGNGRQGPDASPSGSHPEPRKSGRGEGAGMRKQDIR
jgi:hypothetical protein